MSRLRRKKKASDGGEGIEPVQEGCGDSVSQSVKFSLQRINRIVDTLTTQYNQTQSGKNSYFAEALKQFTQVRNRLKEADTLLDKLKEPFSNWIRTGATPPMIAPLANFSLRLKSLHAYLAYLKDVANWCKWEQMDIQSEKVISILQSDTIPADEKRLVNNKINEINSLMSQQQSSMWHSIFKPFPVNQPLNKKQKKRLIKLIRSNLKTNRSRSNRAVTKMAKVDQIVCIKTLIMKGKQEEMAFNMDKPRMGSLFSTAFSEFTKELLHLITCIFKNAYQFLMASSPDFRQLIEKAQGSAIGKALSPENRQRLTENIKSRGAAGRERLNTILQKLGITIPNYKSLSADQLSQRIFQRLDGLKTNMTDLIANFLSKRSD